MSHLDFMLHALDATRGSFHKSWAYGTECCIQLFVRNGDPYKLIRKGIAQMEIIIILNNMTEVTSLINIAFVLAKLWIQRVN